MKSFLRHQIKVFLSKVNPEFYVKESFKANLKYNPNFKNPKTHNERMAKRRFEYTKEMTLLSDKIAVRKYVRDLIGEKYLVPMLFEVDTLNEAIYEQLPDSFVIKANHGSGFNAIVKNKADYSYNELKKITDAWLKTKYYLLGMELHYKAIKPRLIVEELLLDEQGSIPKDYKFHCFKNKIYLSVFVDRFVDTKVAFFDDKWQIQEYPYKFKQVIDSSKIKKPNNFEDMVQLATKLSQPFDYVRLDLYSVNNKIYFGEYTFTPGGGIDAFKSYEKDLEWGKLWD